MEFLSLQGERLAEWLGIQTVVWQALSVASRVFQGEGWVRMMLRLQDTGRSEGVSSGQVEGQVDSGGRETGWRLVAGAICGGSSDLQDPSDSAAQFGGNSDLQDPSDFAAQFEGSSDFQDQSDFAAQFGGSSDFQDQSDFAAQFGGSSDFQDQSDFAAQFGGSSAQFGGSSGSKKASGQLSSGGPVVRQVSRPAREPEDPEFPTPSVQVGGSSSSHGMQVPSFESTGFSYEDYVSVEGSLDAWPMVGTWLKVHYLLQIFSSVGEVLLEMLGLRSCSWLRVRGTSSAVRIGLYGAVVDYLRNGHEAWRYQGPQWVIAVEEFLLSGSRETGSGGAGLGPVGVPGPRVRPSGFPYVEGPPGVVSHYLWTVFMTVGSLVLDQLGDRVSSWGYLRATADGFRSSVTMALIIWLRRTHRLYTARSQETYDAAEAYMQRGEIQFPFAQLANVEPAVVEASSESEIVTGSSTTEPSIVTYSSDARSSEPSGNPVGSETPRNDTGNWEALIALMSSSVEPLEEEEEIASGSSDTPNRFRRIWSFGSGRPFCSVRTVVWLFVWVLWGCIKAAAADEGDDGLCLGSEATKGSMQQVVPVFPYATDVDLPCEDSVIGCDGSVLWEVCRCFLVVMTWELCKRLVAWIACVKRTRVETGCQTSPTSEIPMPLADSVPCRGKILFCLWRSGLKFDVELYSERIQSEFYWLLGDYLRRVEDGLVSESDSD